VNLLLFSDADLIDANRIRISGRRLQHLLEIHRAKPGDSIRVGQLGGDMGLGELLELDSSQATIVFSLTQKPPPKIPLTLVLALPRPKMLRRILRTIAELGVPELHLINSYRVEKSYWQTPVLEPATIGNYLEQGLEQARDTLLPKVNCHQRFKPFVEDVLPKLALGKKALLAHPGDYPPAPGEMPPQTLLVIGPEGGFIPYEVDKLLESGCEAVSLGPRILRVENAVNVLLGRFQGPFVTG
jgi:RsmE family RNA methyltransferase